MPGEAHLDVAAGLEDEVGQHVAHRECSGQDERQVELVAAEHGHHNHGAPVREPAQVQQALHLQGRAGSSSTSPGGFSPHKCAARLRLGDGRDKSGLARSCGLWHARAQSVQLLWAGLETLCTVCQIFMCLLQTSTGSLSVGHMHTFVHIAKCVYGPGAR